MSTEDLPKIVDTSRGGGGLGEEVLLSMKKRDLDVNTDIPVYSLKTDSDSVGAENGPRKEISPQTTFSLSTDVAISPRDLIPDATKRPVSPTNPKEVVADALKRLVRTSSKDSKRSSLLSRVLDVEQPPDRHDSVLSSPTVSCGTFSDDDFSICSADDNLLFSKSQLKNPKKENPSANIETDDLLSMSSSLNTRRQKQIATLRKKLHTSEMTKLELLNQCAAVYNQLEKVECNQAKVKTFRTENVKLREESATMERDFMNEVNKLVNQIAEMDKKHSEELTERERRVEALEEELKKLKTTGEEWIPVLVWGFLYTNCLFSFL